MPKTDDQKKREAAAERDRAARRRDANARLKALPQSSRDAVRRRAAELEARHKETSKARVTAVQFLEQALDEFGTPGSLRTTGSGALRVVEGSETGDKPTPRPRGPREKSTPKEKGRPDPETKDPEELAGNAAKARGGKAGIAATVSVTVPEGTAYCRACDTNKPEAEFWPVTRTDKSKRRRICRPCYNAEWKAWDEKRRAAHA